MTAPADSETLIVTQNGSGQYSRIQDAVNAAPAGARILIQRGIYRERLRIGKPLTLQGVDDRTLIVVEYECSTERVGILCDSSHVVIRGMTLMPKLYNPLEGLVVATDSPFLARSIPRRWKHATPSRSRAKPAFSPWEPPSDDPAIGIRVTQPDVMIEDCVLDGEPIDHFVGMDVTESGQAIIRQSSIFKADIGVRVQRGLITIEDCDVNQNRIGVLIKGSRQVRISGTNISSRRTRLTQDGIIIDPDLFLPSQVHEGFVNEAGIVVEAGTLQIQNSKVHNVPQHGILASYGLISAAECRVWSNGGSGLYLESSNAEVHDCRIQDNGSHGISLFNSFIELSSSDVTGNRGYGIDLKKVSRAALTGTRLGGNRSGNWPSGAEHSIHLEGSIIEDTATEAISVSEVTAPTEETPDDSRVTGAPSQLRVALARFVSQLRVAWSQSFASPPLTQDQTQAPPPSGEPLLPPASSLQQGEVALPYQSCFISYASEDETFAKRLYSELNGKGVRCWYAPEDLPIGAKTRDTIHQKISEYDKLLLIISENSIASDWVEDEVEKALERERRENRLVLFPIRIDEAVMTSDKAWAATIYNARHIGDFRNWYDRAAYETALTRLLRDMRTDSEAVSST